MKIAINARLLNERNGGPYRCLVNILSQISETDSVNTYYLVFNGRPKTGYSFFRKKNFIPVVIPVKNRFVFDYILLPLYSYFRKRDIYYFPKTTFAPWIRGKKIPVFHDIIYFENMGFREFKFFDNLHHTLMIPFCSKFSDACISVSEFTCSRMKELLNIPENMITVIPNAVEESFRVIKDEVFLKGLREKYGLKDPFLFFAGSLSPRKNILNIIKAFELIKDRIPHMLYFTAGESWNDGEVFQYIKNAGLEDRIVKLGFLPEEELVGIYNLADCYLYPSLYEGFGLPILEAQACGCPVITGSAASCPEVAGDSALLVDPLSPRDIADAVLRIQEKEVREFLVKKGFENIKRYSWRTSAEQHLDLFRKVFRS